jgi:hypothetical protein
MGLENVTRTKKCNLIYIESQDTTHTQAHNSGVHTLLLPDQCSDRHEINPFP